MNNLIQQSNEEIVNTMIERLLIISNNHRIITMYGFDEESHNKWQPSGLEVLASMFNGSFISSAVAKINPYIINVKIIFNAFNALNIETREEYSNRTMNKAQNNYGEIWHLHIKSTQDIEDIFCLLGSSLHFSDDDGTINNSEWDININPMYN